MKKNKRASLGTRFKYYKWSGPIVFVPLIVLGVFTWAYFENEKEFFTAWSCQTIEDYLLNKDVPDRFPTHNELTENQHIKLHKILDECKNDAKFSPKINHETLLENNP